MLMKMQSSILVLLLVTFASCEDYKSEEDVLVLTDDNIGAALEEFEHILVEFCK